MSRVPSDVAEVPSGYKTFEPELPDDEVIVELRNSLGAISEVAYLYGTGADFDDLQYSDDFSSSDDSESSVANVPEHAKEPVDVAGDSSAEEAPEDAGGQSDADLNYITSIDDVDPRDSDDWSFSEDDEDEPPAVSAAAARYEALRQQTNRRLAGLATFLPDKMRRGLDKQFAKAVEPTRDKTDEKYEAASASLTALNESLDAKSPQLQAAEAKHLRQQIRRNLDVHADLLVASDKAGFEKDFTELDVDAPSENRAATKQVEDLKGLAGDLTEAINARIKELNDLYVDYERLEPIIERALSIESEQHDALEKAKRELDGQLGSRSVSDGQTYHDLDQKMKAVQSLAEAIFKDFSIDDAKAQQKASLPASVDSLAPKGAALGKGAFGEVYELANDGDTRLVGKSFDASSAKARKEMEHEAEMYARLGDHPNIANCFGIHEVDLIVDTQPMLVMDKIEGQDAETVLADLDARYRDGKVTREEYLAAIQHVMKGTLKGLSHMEAMGLVHKDIKGDNVKFDTRTNQAVLIDMGLAQQEGVHENQNMFFPTMPPEQFVKQGDDEVVTKFWDSFTVGKMLFEEMERDQSGARQVLVPGGETFEKPPEVAGFGPKLGDMRKANKAALERTDSGEFQAQTEADGQLVGQALKRGATPEEAGEAGKYGAATQYVDFMNRLTHPDPKQRMSPSEALKHPFLVDAILADNELDRVFGPPTGVDPTDAKTNQPAPRQALPDAGYFDEDGNPVSSDEDISSRAESSDSSEPSGELKGVYIDDLGNAASADEDFSSSEEFSDSSESSGELKGVYIDDLGDADSAADDFSSSEEFSDSSESGSAVQGGYVDDLGNAVSSDEGFSSSEESGEELRPEDLGYVGDDASEEDSSLEGDSSAEEASEDAPVPPAPPAPAAAPVAPPAEDVAAKLKGDASPLKVWKIAVKQVDQQFNAAYASLKADKAQLKAAGFTKGNKFSKYFTYNKDLDKLLKLLEKARAANHKDTPKVEAKVTAATKHYRDKITRKANADFGWANADPPVSPPFWNTLIAALDDVDEYIAS